MKNLPSRDWKGDFCISYLLANAAGFYAIILKTSDCIGGDQLSTDNDGYGRWAADGRGGKDATEAI